MFRIERSAASVKRFSFQCTASGFPAGGEGGEGGSSKNGKILDENFERRIKYEQPLTVCYLFNKTDNSKILAASS